MSALIPPSRPDRQITLSDPIETVLERLIAAKSIDMNLGDYVIVYSLHREDADGIDETQVRTIASPGMSAERQSQLIDHAILADA